MLNTCGNCKGVFTFPEVLVSEKDNIQVYDRRCHNCGSGYRIWVKQMESPKVSGLELEKIENKPR